MIASATAATLDGTFDINNTSRLAEFDLNGSIFSNGPLGTAAGPIQFTLNTLTYVPAIGAAVPEPSTWAMMLLGFAGLGFAFRKTADRGAVWDQYVPHQTH
jgi:hypothetical protein